MLNKEITELAKKVKKLTKCKCEVKHLEVLVNGLLKDVWEYNYTSHNGVRHDSFGFYELFTITYFIKDGIILINGDYGTHFLGYTDDMPSYEMFK